MDVYFITLEEQPTFTRQDGIHRHAAVEAISTLVRDPPCPINQNRECSKEVVISKVRRWREECRYLVKYHKTYVNNKAVLSRHFQTSHSHIITEPCVNAKRSRKDGFQGETKEHCYNLQEAATAVMSIKSRSSLLASTMTLYHLFQSIWQRYGSEFVVVAATARMQTSCAPILWEHVWYQVVRTDDLNTRVVDIYLPNERNQFQKGSNVVIKICNTLVQQHSKCQELHCISKVQHIRSQCLTHAIGNPSSQTWSYHRVFHHSELIKLLVQYGFMSSLSGGSSTIEDLSKVLNGSGLPWQCNPKTGCPLGIEANALELTFRLNVQS